MPSVMKNSNFSPNVTVFYGESLDDLALMPTTTTPGRGKYVHGLAEKGSVAEILDEDGMKYFMLRTTGWVDITDSQIEEILE